MTIVKSNDFFNIDNLTEKITNIIKPYYYDDIANAVFCINSYVGNRSILEVSLALNNAIAEADNFGKTRINNYSEFSNLCKRLSDEIGCQEYIDYIEEDLGVVKINAFENIYSIILGTGYNNGFSKVYSLPFLAEILDCESDVKYVFDYSSCMIESLKNHNEKNEDEDYTKISIPPQEYYNVATEWFNIKCKTWNLKEMNAFIDQPVIEKLHFIKKKENYYPLYNTSILLDVYEKLFSLLTEGQKSSLINNVLNKLLWDLHRFDVGIHASMLSPCKIMSAGEVIVGDKGLAFVKSCSKGCFIGINASVYSETEIDSVCQQIKDAIQRDDLSAVELMHRCSEEAFLKAKLSNNRFYVVLINSVLPQVNIEVQRKYNSFVSECSLNDMIYYLCFSGGTEELINYLQFKHENSDMRVIGFGGDSSLFLTWKLQNERIEGGAVNFSMISLDPYIDSSYVIDYYKKYFLTFSWYRDCLIDPVFSWNYKFISPGVLECVSKNNNFGGLLFSFTNSNFKIFICTNIEFFIKEKDIEGINNIATFDEIAMTLVESLRNCFDRCNELDSITIELLQMPFTYFEENVGINERTSGIYVNCDSKFAGNTLIIRYSIDYKRLFEDIASATDRSIETSFIKELFRDISIYFPATYTFLVDELASIESNKKLVGLYETTIEYKYNPSIKIRVDDKYYIDARKLIANVCLENGIQPGEYIGSDANRLIRTIQSQLIYRFENEVKKYNYESLHNICLDYYAQAVHEFVLEKTKYSNLNSLDDNEQEIIKGKIIDYRQKLQHEMNDLLYLIETNLSIHRSEDRIITKEEFSYLYALSHWLVLLSETADICHFVSDWIYVTINSEYNIDTEVYEINGTSEYNRRTYESRDYEINNDANDKIHLDNILKGFEHDAGFSFTTMTDMLAFMEMRGTEIANPVGDNVYSVNLQNAILFMQEELLYSISYEELYRALDFLCVNPDELKTCKGKTYSYIPIGNRKERNNRFEIKPFLIVNENLVFSPPHLNYVKHRWINGLLGFYPPFEYDMDQMCECIKLWKKDYEDKIVDEVSTYFKDSGFDYVNKDVYLHKFDKKGKHPKNLGDYDVLAINTMTKEIWIIECKVIKKVGSFYEMYQQQHHFFITDKNDEKFSKRIAYMESNYTRILDVLGLKNEEYTIVPKMCVNKVFASRFKEVDFEIVSLDELRQLICSTE